MAPTIINFFITQLSLIYSLLGILSYWDKGVLYVIKTYNQFYKVIHSSMDPLFKEASLNNIVTALRKPKSRRRKRKEINNKEISATREESPNSESFLFFLLL